MLWRGNDCLRKVAYFFHVNQWLDYLQVWIFEWNISLNKKRNRFAEYKSWNMIYALPSSTGNAAWKQQEADFETSLRVVAMLYLLCHLFPIISKPF